MSRRLIAALLVMALTACALADARPITDSWKGRHIDDVIIAWGPPASMYRAEDGRTTATFSHSRMSSGVEYYCHVTYSTTTAGVIDAATIDGNIGGCNRFFSDKRAATD